MHPRFPLPDPDFEPLAPFWEGAKQHKLLMPYDVTTQKIVWYPKTTPQNQPYGTLGRARDNSAKDSSATTKNAELEVPDYDWREVSGRGTLFSWVVVSHAFLPQYKSALPFITALVALEEDPKVRLATQIVDAKDSKDLFGDMPLEVVFKEMSYEGVLDSDGKTATVIAPFFRPA